MEKNLLDKAKIGNIDAFEQLILKFEKLYYNIAFRMLSNHEDAKDITQDSLIKIYKSLDKCTDEDLFKSWSCRIVTNTAIDLIRSKKRKPSISLDREYENEENTAKMQYKSDEMTPEEKIIAKEEQNEILESINQLPETQKNAIILRDLNNLSYEEISEILDISLGTVKSRINRARKSLRDIIIKYKEQNNNRFV